MIQQSRRSDQGHAGNEFESLKGGFHSHDHSEANRDAIQRCYRFRSRLEARWAVFFEHLSLRWEYEPEGFVLRNGVYYLPDFRIHLADGVLWAEVKPLGESTDVFEAFMEELAGVSALRPGRRC
jgi:hypothetical protein